MYAAASRWREEDGDGFDEPSLVEDADLLLFRTL